MPTTNSTTWGLPPDTTAAPRALHELRQWVCWRAKLKPNGKYDKIPVQPDMRAAMTNAPSTWCTYREAVTGYDLHDEISGIGLCLKGARISAHQLCVIDIDDSTDHPLLDTFDTTTSDTSPSGTGMHIYLLVQLDDPDKPLKSWKTKGVEFFADSGYVTTTWRNGNHQPLQGYKEAQVREALEAYAPQRTPTTSTTPVDWDFDEAREALTRIDPDCDYSTWLKVGLALHAGSGASLLAYSLWDLWSIESPKYQANTGGNDMHRMWDNFQPEGKTTLNSLYYLAGPKPTSPDEFEDVTPQARPLFSTAVNAASLLGPPPVRQWCWDEWMPIGTVTALAGPPASAKSTMALQLSIHKALGLPFFGQPMSQGQATFITVEDDMPELWNRVHRICNGLGVDVATLTELDLHSLSEEDTLLVTTTKDNGIQPKRLIAAWDAYFEDRKTSMLVLDLVSDFWDGSENVRQEVSPYIRKHLGGFAKRHQMGVLALSHPSVAAMKDGRALAGSTAVLGSYRSVIGMRRQDEDTNRIDVARTKANYADLAQTIVRWDHGYLREIGQEQIVREEQAKQIELWREHIIPAVQASLRPDGLTTVPLVVKALGGETVKRNGDNSMHKGRVEKELSAMVAAGLLVDGSEKQANGSDPRKTYAIADVLS